MNMGCNLHQIGWYKSGKKREFKLRVFKCRRFKATRLRVVVLYQSHLFKVKALNSAIKHWLKFFITNRKTQQYDFFFTV